MVLLRRSLLRVRVGLGLGFFRRLGRRVVIVVWEVRRVRRLLGWVRRKFG